MISVGAAHAVSRNMQGRVCAGKPHSAVDGLRLGMLAHGLQKASGIGHGGGDVGVLQAQLRRLQCIRGRQSCRAGSSGNRRAQTMTLKPDFLP